MKSFLDKYFLVIAILFLASVPFTLHLFQHGFFVGDDGEWMIIRSSAFHEALRDGQIPVRLLGRLNHEFGYPVATFLYPGYLYLTEPLVIAGFSFIDSIKLMFTLTMILSGVFSFLWLKKLFDKWPALLGALVYLYTPYHLVDMYTRGSLGELLALAVVPFVFWQIERRSIFFSAIGIAGLILSHNILAAVFLPFVLLYIILRVTKRRVTFIAVVLLIALGLSACFWIPAIFELQYTMFNQTKISEWQQYFASFSQIGGFPLLVLTSSCVVFILRKYFNNKHALLHITKHIPLFIFFTCTGLLSVFFSSFLSTPLWPILPVSFIQFPFRFLSLEIIAIAFLTAFLFEALRPRQIKIFFFIGITLLLALSAWPSISHIQAFDKGEGFYTTNQSTTTTRDEYMPVWVKEKPIERANEKVIVINGNALIKNSIVNNKAITFTANATNNAVIQINKIYWPGWVANIDGKSEIINYKNPKGVMTLPVSPGQHSVQFIFQETSLRLFSDIISATTIIVLLVLLISKRLIKIV